MSNLNPEAPDFFPSWFSSTEDFSPQWWTLVKSNSSFRDYWIRERFDLDQEVEDEFEEEGEEEDPLMSPPCLQEQDANSCLVKTRLVKNSDLVAAMNKMQHTSPRLVPDKFAQQVPAKLAAQIHKGSAAAQRIQQPR